MLNYLYKEFTPIRNHQCKRKRMKCSVKKKPTRIEDKKKEEEEGEEEEE